GGRRRSARRACRGAARRRDGYDRPRRQRDAGAGLLPRPLCGGPLGYAEWPAGRPARPSPAGCAPCGGAAMTLRLYIPLDAAALAVGADEVAAGIEAAAARRNVAIDIIRTGSRGLYWLEPMVEAETPAD